MRNWLASGVCAIALPLLASADPPVYEVTVKDQRPLTSGSEFVIDAEAVSLRRLDRPDKILELIPGLLTAQHAGGGKSNQYLVRGFDADHGTDFAFFLDGVPLNMRSHAHGQGFAEMHFIIPETIEAIDVAMGPYSLEYGDFATAGAANLRLFQRIPESFLRVTAGSFDSVRTVGVYSPDMGIFGGENPSATLLGAFEFNTTNGPFENHEDLLQYKGLIRFDADLAENTHFESWFTAYSGRWNASGQIPERFADEFGWFDSADPTEGGHSSRQILQARITHDFDADKRLVVSSWASHYAFDLFSDFTLFLDNPVDGDGIQQQDDRIYYGNKAVYRQTLDLALPTVLSFGLDQRTDDAYVRLSTQRHRKRLERTSAARVTETSLAAFAEAETLLAPWARFVGGVRAEGFWFHVKNRYENETGDRANGNVSEDIYLPKANFILTPFSEAGPAPVAFQPLRDSEFYFNFGEGFHSNDARGVVANPQEQMLPIALGWEVGWRAPIQDWVDLSIAYWWLNIESELVFVGDAGDTEPKGRSERRGIEVAARFTPLEWLHGEIAVSYSDSRFANGEAVPQAPRFIGKANIVADVVPLPGLTAELDFNSLGPRYAVEDRSVLLHGFGVFDFALRYRRGPFEGIVGVDNIFNAQWRSSEFYYESRLASEVAAGLPGVEDWSFTPGWPRNYRVGLTYYLP